MNYLQQQIQTIKPMLNNIGTITFTAFVTFSITWIAATANAESTVAQSCINQQSQYWNELQLLKQNIKDNLDKVQAEITKFEDGLNDTITSVQGGMEDNNKENKERIGQGL